MTDLKPGTHEYEKSCLGPQKLVYSTRCFFLRTLDCREPNSARHTQWMTHQVTLHEVVGLKVNIKPRYKNWRKPITKTGFKLPQGGAP